MKRRSFSKILCTFLAGTLTLSVGMIGVGAAQIDDSFVSAETASPATGLLTVLEIVSAPSTFTLLKVVVGEDPDYYTYLDELFAE